MKKIKSYLIFIILVAALLLLSKPDFNKHKEEIIKKYKEENPIAGKLGTGDYFVKMISYHDNYVFSTTKSIVNSKTLSFGIAGFVIIVEDLDINKYKDLLDKQHIK